MRTTILEALPTRTCIACGVEGPATLFTVTKWNGDSPWFNGRCRPCYNKYCQEKRAKPENVRKIRDNLLRKNYGIGLDEYEAMYAAQGGRCAICANTSPGTTEHFHVDHNHITGVVRGLLCSACNLAIGMLKSDEGTALLEKAVQYVSDTQQ